MTSPLGVSEVVGRVFSVFHPFARASAKNLCTRVPRYPRLPSAKLSRDNQRTRASVLERRGKRDSPLSSGHERRCHRGGLLGEEQDGGRRVEGGERRAVPLSWTSGG